MLIKRLPAILYYVGLSIYLALERSLQEPDVLENTPGYISGKKFFDFVKMVWPRPKNLQMHFENLKTNNYLYCLAG